mmetsp:Transcript_76332/g.150963  ORF Transcript_76332/g.150963 Transcript_76332/m.150963 type:complete len:495 (+) Transcript_76332:52-1536(+)
MSQPAKRRRLRHKPAGAKSVTSETPATASDASSAVDGGLAWLLGKSTTVKEFRSETFERDALHICRRAPKYYNSLLGDLASPEAFFKRLDTGDVGLNRVNLFRCRDGSTKEVPSKPLASAKAVRRHFSEGWSLQVLQPQQEHGPLAALVARLESEFGCLVGVNAYLTPPGAQGLAPHWDDVDVFVLQLSGSKSWTLHRSTVHAPLPPGQQALPRYSSGDLPLDSLSKAFLQPRLSSGDLLYFPRGTIHYAPNRDGNSASVHLTVSAFQRQSVFDLSSKVFEEAMSEMWEVDEKLRHALPWRSLAPTSTEYPVLCRSMATVFSRLAKALEGEAKTAIANKGRPRDGFVATALAELGADFVRSRMPPRPRERPSVTCDVVSPSSHVMVADTSVVALVPGLDAGAPAELIHCMRNSQEDHMMSRDMPEDGLNNGLELNPALSSILHELCATSSKGDNHKKYPIESILRRLGVPNKNWPQLCQVLTGLAVQGVVQIQK